MFKPSKKSLIYAAAGSISFLLICSFLAIFRSPTLSILKYPLTFVTCIRREMGAAIFYHRNFTEYERLKKETDTLNSKLNLARELYLENRRLKTLLAFKQKSSYKVRAARVIGRSPDSWASTVIIDKGSGNGIKRGCIAVTPLGLAGRVVETAETTSKVMLMNDVNISVSAMVQRTRQEGLVSGTLGNTLIMRYLPQESDIRVSDVVITSGLTEMYPKGLLIGTVEEVRDEFSGLSRYAIIKPAVNLADIEEVLVIIS